jgi:hypothetical protein
VQIIPEEQKNDSNQAKGARESLHEGRGGYQAIA